jgi:hypothetical protein
MRSEPLQALRIALAFSGAFVLAEGSDTQLTFIAPLVAGAVAAAAPPGLVQLALLPFMGWGIAVFAGLLLQALHGLPIALAVLMFGVFAAAFRLCERPATAAAGLVTLVLCAIIPEVMIKAPELAGDVARWCFGNFAAASIAVLLANRLIPPSHAREHQVRLVPPLGAWIAAAVLLCAVWLAVIFSPPAPGAALVGVVIALRPDRTEPSRVIRNRLIAAVVGGAAAAAAWEVMWLAPDLLVFGTVTLGLAWVIALRIVAGGPDAGAAMKSLNAFGILVGQGFSIFYDDTDDRVWTRIAGVVLGIVFAALALVLLRPAPGRPRMAPAAA